MPAWSGLYNGVEGANYSGPTITPNPSRRIRRVVRGLAAVKIKTVLRVLVNGAVGETATASHSQVKDGTGYDLGGKRTIITVSDINRATTTTDRDKLLVDIDNKHTPPFPREKGGTSGASGNQFSL